MIKEKTEMERQELINLVEILSNGGMDSKTGKQYSEKEYDRLMELFERNIKNKNGSDLLFYPEDCGLPSDATVEEIVDKAMEDE